MRDDTRRRLVLVEFCDAAVCVAPGLTAGRETGTISGGVRELDEVEGWLAAGRGCLASQNFVARAPGCGRGAGRAREADLAHQVTRLRGRPGR